MEINNKILNEEVSADWRGCLMLSMPPWFSGAIQSFGRSQIEESNFTKDGLETYSHCTILYGFSKSIPFEAVKEYFLKKYVDLIDDKITIRLGKINRFQNEEFDVIKIEVDSEILTSLHEDFKSKFSVTTKFPDYNPHITIAYIKPNSVTHLDDSSLYEGLTIECDEITYSYGPDVERVRKKITYEEFKEKIQRTV